MEVLLFVYCCTMCRVSYTCCGTGDAEGGIAESWDIGFKAGLSAAAAGIGGTGGNFSCNRQASADAEESLEMGACTTVDRVVANEARRDASGDEKWNMPDRGVSGP